MQPEAPDSAYNPQKAALRIAALYILVGCLYIVISDQLLSYPQLDGIYQSIKGILFVLFTGLGLYLILSRYLRRLSKVIMERLMVSAALQTALERFPGPSALFDGEKKVLYVNHYAVEMARKPASHIVGNPLQDVFPLISRSGYVEFLDKAIASAEPVSGEISFNVDTQTYYYVTTFIPLVGPSGAVDRVAALAYDVSERKNSAVRNEQQKRELRLIIDLIPNLVFAKDTSGRYILANDAFSKFHGISTEEVIGKTAREILPDPTLAPEMEKEDYEVIKKGREVFRAHQAMFDSDGKRRVFQVVKIPFRTATDNKVAVLGLAVDITERLQNEEEINKSQARFKALVNHSLDALFVYDNTGTVTLVNERACELIGRSPHQLVGQNFNEILTGDLPSNSLAVKHPIYTPGSCFQLLLHGPNDHELPVEIRVGPLPGDIEGAFLAEARDISERLLIERERASLSRLGIALSASRNASEVAQTLFDAIRAYVQLDAFYFAIRISGKGRFRQNLIVDTINGSMQYFPSYDYNVRADSPLREVYEGKSLLLLRAGAATSTKNFSPFGNRTKPSQSLMYFPVLAGDRVVAVMSVQSYQMNFYTQEHVDLIQRMADMAGPALESARANRHGSIFTELGRQLGAARTAADVAEVIATMADDLAGWDACAIAIYSQADDNITYIYLADEMDGVRQRIDESMAFKRPRYLTERVLKEGAFIILREKDATGELLMLPNQAGKAPLSMLWAPIPGENGQPTGFMTLHRYTTQAYDDDDLESIRALAEHCGAALSRTASQELLRYTEERYRLAIESTGAVAYQLDYLSMEYVFMGQEIEAITGYPPESFTAALWKKISLESHLDPACNVSYDDEGRKHFKQWRTEVRIRRIDGQERWLSDQAVQLHNSAGTPTGTLGIIRDITEQKRVELALRASEERYALSARGANDGLWDWDLKTDRIHFSERWAQMLGYPVADFSTPEEWFEQIHPNDLESMRTLLQEHLLAATRHFECEVRTRHREGTYRWMLIRGIAVRNAEGTPTRIAGSQTDITDRIMTQERLLHDALHDPLTGLPNRSLLMEHLGRCMEHLRRRSDYQFALIFMDLDRFKTINDSLGHLMGDHVLVTVSQRLKSAIRPMDIVARFAGDEFAIVLDQIIDQSEIVDIVNRVQLVVSEPIIVDNHEITTSVSAGVAIGALHYGSPSEILRDADNALYKSKSDGSGRFRIFDTSMHEHAVRMLRMEADLRRSVERGQMRLAFQPIINVLNGKVERFEALIRWEHPELGLLYPDQFMPMAEETGLVFALDEWAIREACRSWKNWQMEARPDEAAAIANLKLNVNLSPRHFLRHVNLTECLSEIVLSEGLHPSLIGLELTENALLSFREETTVALHEMKKAGFSLYLDDFGKGYSSLSYLHNFPFDVVKIDRLFIMRMQDDGPEREVVHAILSLAARLRLGVVAEGVETAKQMEIVRSLGCDAAQGFYMSRPVSPEVALNMVQESRSW